MANLRRIEEMRHRLASWGWATTPVWLMPMQKKEWPEQTMHFSGQLREADRFLWKGRTGVAHEVLDSDELAVAEFLNEAAERLDDAHEAWLEEQIQKLEAHLQCLIV